MSEVPLSDSTILAALHEIARGELGLHGDLPDGDLGEHLDSVQRLTLVVGIEDHFEICFEPEDEDAVCTLQDVVSVVRTKLAQLHTQHP